jgi:hypothetical protein
MRPGEHDTQDNSLPPTRRRPFELAYLEHTGDGNGRTHLRFTRLGVAVILLLTIIPLVALLVLFLMNSRRPTLDVNTNVRTLPAPSPATSPVIRPAPPVSPSGKSKRPNVITPASPTPRVKGGDAGGQAVTDPTPPPLPSESPP